MSDVPEKLVVIGEWASKAEDDLIAASKLIEIDAPAWIVCFHAQQAAEKYLKAMLMQLDVPFRRLHDIGELLRLLPESERPPLDAVEAFDLTAPRSGQPVSRGAGAHGRGGQSRLDSRGACSRLRPWPASSPFPLSVMSDFVVNFDSAEAKQRARCLMSDPAFLRTAMAAVLTLAVTACGGSGPTQVSANESLDLDGLVEALRRDGATAQLGGEVSQPFFSVRGRMVVVDGADIQVFEFRDAGAAMAEAARVSSDGGTIGTTSVLWVAPPHFYRRGRLIVLYVGESGRVITALDAVLGRQFAGR